MNRPRHRPTIVAALMAVSLAAILTASPAFAAGQAPLGTYQGILGKTSIIGGSRQATGGQRRFRRRAFAPQRDLPITITIDSYSPSSELNALRAVEGNPQEFANLLTSYHHGTVQMGAETFPINVATSRPSAGGYVINLMAAHPFLQPIRHGRLARKGTRGGTGIGLIRLHLKADGTGSGSLETTHQVVISADYEVLGQGGVSARTEINQVTRK